MSQYFRTVDSLLQSIWTRVTIEYSDESATYIHHTACSIKLVRDYYPFDDDWVQVVPSNYNSFIDSKTFFPV